jgi:hypothetical protein
MCFSANGSLGTYSIAMALAALVKYKGLIDPKLWIFMAIFTHMQLVEYFLWKNLTVPKLNTLWSAVGLALVLAEGAGAVNLFSDKRPLALYTVIALAYILTQPIDFRTTVGGNGHLKWNWLMPAWSPWLFGWLLAMFVPLYMTKEYVGLAYGLGVFFISMFFNFKYGTTGSYWCVLALGTWVLALLGMLKH